METTIPQSVLSDIKKDYSESLALLETNEWDLTESLVAQLNSARTLLENIVNKISSYRTDHGHALRGALWIAMANINSVSEEVHEQESNLRKAFSELGEVGHKPFVVLQEIEGLNQLGWLWINRACYEEGKRHLEAANAIYKEYCLRGNELHSIASLMNPSFAIEDSNQALLEKANLCTVCALAKANQELGYNEEAAEGCLYALDKQLELGHYDPLDWTTKALEILPLLMNGSMYRTAKKYLAIAVTLCSGEEEVSEHRRRLQGRAHVMWGKLCEAVLNRTEECMDKAEVPAPTHVQTNSEVMNTPVHEVSSLQEALNIFTIGESALKKASLYFSLDDHCLDNVVIVLCTCSMLQRVFEFESRPGEKYKLLRRQVATMDPVVKVLNPAHYMQECQTLWLGSGRVYADMLLLKKKPPLLRNKLISLALKNYSQFVSSYKLSQISDSQTGMTVILTYLEMGKLYGKYEPPEDVGEAIQAQCRCYRVIRSFFQEHPDSPILAVSPEETSEMLLFINQFLTLNQKPVPL